MEKTVWKKIWEWVEPLIIAGVVAAIMFFVCWPLRVVGPSMESTFKDRDRAFMSRVMIYMDKIDRGDIVVCNIDEEEGPNIVKRIIGLPNERVSIQDGIVYIDMKKWIEPYLDDGYTSGDLDIVLGENEYFVLGDNRPVSKDSRQLGPISKEAIIGKVFFKFYPFNNMSRF